MRARAAGKLQEWNITDVYWDVEQELILGTNNRKGLLQEFLEHERERTLEVRPAYFEVGFGSRVGKISDPALFQKEPVVAGTVSLRGKVDRIDIEFCVTNTGGAPFEFTAALHSYLLQTQVEDAVIEPVMVFGKFIDQPRIDIQRFANIAQGTAGAVASHDGGDGSALAAKKACEQQMARVGIDRRDAQAIANRGIGR